MTIHWSIGIPTGELAQEIGTSHSIISAIPFQLEKRHTTLPVLLFFISHISFMLRCAKYHDIRQDANNFHNKRIIAHPSGITHQTPVMGMEPQDSEIILLRIRSKITLNFKQLELIFESPEGGSARKRERKFIIVHNRANNFFIDIHQTAPQSGLNHQRPVRWGLFN